MKKLFSVLKIAVLSLLLGSIAFSQNMINVWNPSNNTNMYGKSVSAYWRGIAVDKRTTGTGAGRVYVTNSLTGSQKITYWEKAQWDSAVTPATWPAGSFGTTATRAWGATSPYGICIDDDGNVYVSDYNNKKIFKFDPANSYAADSIMIGGTTTFVADTTFRYIHSTGSFSAGTLKLYYVHDNIVAANRNVMMLTQSGAAANNFTKSVLFQESNDGTTNYAALASADGNSIYVSSNGSAGTNGLVKYVYASGVWSKASGWPVIALTIHDINFHGNENALVISVPTSRVFNKVSTTNGTIYYGANTGRGGVAGSVGGAAAYDTSTCFVASSSGTLSWFEKIAYFTPTPLTGDYYIPQGTNPQGFLSLERAFSAINTQGVSGAVRLLIDGDLTESADILALTRSDMNAVNNLVIKPNTGKTPTLTITSVPSSASTRNQYTGIQFEDANYATIDGSNLVGGTTKDLTIKITDATNGRYGIQLWGNCDNNVIKNSTVTIAYNSASTSAAPIEVYGQASGVVDTLLIQNNSLGLLAGTSIPPYAVYLRGYSTSSVYATGIKVIGNIMKGSIRPVYFYYVGTPTTQCQISGNTITSGTTAIVGYVGYGIMMNTWAGTFNIFNNVIDTMFTNSTTSSGLLGIATMSGSSGSVVNIYNNMITNFKGINAAFAGTVYGINIQDGVTANIYYNSIYVGPVTNTTGNTAGIAFTSSSVTADVKNNAVYNVYNSATSYGIYMGSSSYTGVTSDYNDFYVSGALASFGYNGSARKTIAAWQSSSGRDINSVSGDPAFVSASDLHINSTGTEYQPIPFVTGGGTPIAGYTTDIDGITRDASAPDMGADEFGAVNRQITTTGTLTGGVADNLTIDGAGITATLSGNMLVNGTLTLTSGSFDISNGSLTISNPIVGTLANMTAGAATNLTMRGTTAGLAIPSTITTLKSLTVNNVNGIVMNNALSLDSLALLNGALYNGANVLTVTGAEITKINLVSGYVAGPLARTLPASLATGTTYQFPIGKAVGHLFELVNPTTTSGGTVVVQAEQVDANCGGSVGTGISAIKPNRYWNTSITSGVSNFTNATIRITDTLDASSTLASSATQTGAYNSIGGLFDGNRMTSGLVTSLGYIAVGTRGVHLAGGTYTVGPTGTYTNLTAVTSALNNNILDGNVVFELMPAYSSTAETFPLYFYKYANNVTIRPQAGATGMAISGTDTTGAIILSGAYGVTFDGRPGGAGTARELTIANTVFGTYATAPAIQFTNDASKNTLRNCILKAKDTTSSGSIVRFGSTVGVTGNDDNLVEDCEIDGQGTARAGIYSAGTALKENSGNTISNCDIHDIYISTASLSDIYGIYLTSNNVSWTINNNDVYQTTPRTYTNLSGGTVYGIRVNNSSAGGFVITNNVIGGSAPNGAGTPWRIDSGFVKFSGINLTASNSSPTSVQGNIIKNLDIGTSFVTTGSLCFSGLNFSDGSFDAGTVTGNTVGSGTDTSSIRIRILATATTEGGRMAGIYFGGSSGGVVNINNNTVGGITVDCGGLWTAATLNATLSSTSITGTFTMKNNLIGSLTTPKSLKIVNSTSTTVTAIRMAGIRFQAGTTFILNNTVANLAMESAFGQGTLYGILSSGGTTQISDNVVKTLSTISPNVLTNSLTGPIYGIQIDPGNDNYQIISGNQVSDIYNGAAGNLAVWAYGIYPSTTTTATRMLIERNVISAVNVLSNNNSATICGLYGSTGGAVIRNNMVTLGKDASGTDITNPVQMIGLRKATSSSSFIAHNTVLITGSGVSDVGAGTLATMAFQRGTAGIDTVMNNIFANVRSNTNATQQKHYAVRLTNTTTMLENYNVLYTPGTGGYIGSPDGNTTSYATLADWRTATSLDAASINGDPAFKTGSVYINADANPRSVASNAAVPLANVTTDIDGAIRDAVTPDIGADEFGARFATSWGRNVDFGFIDIKNMTQTEIYVKNTGSDQLNITTAAIADTNFRIMPTTAGPIAAGDSAKFTFIYDPAVPGALSSVAVFSHNGYTSPDTIWLAGKSEYPVFAASISSISFGDVAINVPKKDSVYIKNTASVAKLNISNVTATNQRYMVMPGTASINPGDSAKFYVTFTPTSGSVEDGKLIFENDGLSLKDTLGVNGKGALPGFTASKRLVDFGEVMVKSFKHDTVTVSNTSISALIVDKITVKAPFSVMPMSTTINGGELAKFQFTFAPLQAGDFVDTVVFSHNASSLLDTIIAKGTAVVPNFTTSTMNMQFGSVIVAATKMDSIYVKNTGSGLLTVTSVMSNSPEFIVTTPSAATVLTATRLTAEPVVNRQAAKKTAAAGDEVDALSNSKGLITGTEQSVTDPTESVTMSAVSFTVKPADSAKIIIRFTPSSKGVKTAQLFFVHDAPKGADTVQVGGIGVQAGFSVTPSTLVFKTQIIGQNRKDSVTVSNVGTSTLTITGITSSNSDFSISPSTAIIDTGKAQKFFVTFTPSAAGLRSGKIAFVHNGATKDTLSASGTGIAVGTLRLAHNAANGTEVAFEGIATRVKGNYTYMQDTSYGMVMYMSSGPWKDSVTSGGIKVGDKIRVLGKVSEYNSLKEVAAADLYNFTVTSRNNTLPAAKLVTLAKLVTNGEDYEGQLIKVVALKIVAGTDTVYASAKSYSITDPSDTTKTIVLRIPNASDNTIAGKKILTKLVTFTGVLGQFNSSNPAAGYQMMATDSSDITDNLLYVQDLMDMIPTEYQLAQNYPNPFNPSTTIQYGLPKQSNVTVKIYSVLGQEVKTLVNNDQSPSYYRVVWNGTDNNGSHVSSGVYFVRITAQSSEPNSKPFIQVKKMLLMK
jgi:hypothetical protein